MGLPNHIDPRKLAMQIIRLEGAVDRSCLPRLAAAVVCITGPVNAKVSFENQQSRAKLVDGTVGANVEMQCQRCLDSVAIDLQSSFSLQVVSCDEHVDRVAESREPWIVEERMASLHHMLEDELLLVLPAVSYHPSGKCTGDAFMQQQGGDGVIDSPFDILKSIKKRV
ncbi:MAG: YceD family protein [Porticoccaceae bacterium]|nr:YceD family protein [Porticoccaceae bacterium]